VDLFVLVGSVSIGGGTSVAGYGVLQLSDILGNHRVFLEADAIPYWMTAFGLSYVYDALRPDFRFTLQAAENSFLLDPNIVSSRNLDYPASVAGSRGGSVEMSYPLTKYTRIEAAVAAQRIREVFTDRQGYAIAHPATSMIYPVSLSVVRDTSRWRRLLPTGGFRIRLGVTQATPVSADALRFTEYNGEMQWFAGLVDGASIATRWFGAVSDGHNERTYYLGGRYLLRALPFANLRGNAAILGNHELRFNIAKHLDIAVPFMPMLFTDAQGVAFVDGGAAFDTADGFRHDDARSASVGGGVNLVGFMMQASPVVFAIEVARRIDQRQTRPTVYGRLGGMF
jgi:outer membrane protein assembly factor BamA